MTYNTRFTVKCFTFASLIMATGLCQATSYYDERERGWYWYEEPPAKEEPLEEKAPAPVSGLTAELSPTEIIEQQRQEFDQALSAAIINPTQENIIAYLNISQKIGAQAEEFSQAFKQTIWTRPEYDYSLTGRPTSSQAIAAYNQEKSAKNQEKLFDIAEKRGILYFFTSECPYCARFSPVLKRFADTFGFTIIPVTLDGRGNSEFPYPKSNQYLVEKLNVSLVPATFLVDPDMNIVSTIGYGYSDWSTLLSKVLAANVHIEQPNTDAAIRIGGLQ